jgi:hypothetical protein
MRKPTRATIQAVHHYQHPHPRKHSTSVICSILALPWTARGPRDAKHPKSTLPLPFVYENTSVTRLTVDVRVLVPAIHLLFSRTARLFLGRDQHNWGEHAKDLGYEYEQYTVVLLDVDRRGRHRHVCKLTGVALFRTVFETNVQMMSTMSVDRQHTARRCHTIFPSGSRPKEVR